MTYIIYGIGKNMFTSMAYIMYVYTVTRRPRAYLNYYLVEGNL